MRISYYRFPAGTDEKTLLDAGCGVMLKDGREIYPDSIPDEKRPLVDHVGDTISCCVSAAKRMLKQYGGCAWTEHIERDGGVFEVTEITLNGNNSRFTYNHHL